MARFDMDGLDRVVVRDRAVGSRTISAAILSRAAEPPAKFPSYEIHLSDGSRAYRIVGVDGFESAERVARGAPDPCAANDGATARHAYRSSHDGRRWHHSDFLRTVRSGGTGDLDEGRYHALDKFGYEAPEDTPPDPVLFAVAIDATRRCSGDAEAALGRVRSVYAYVPVPEERPDGSPPAYLMRFVGNAAERGEVDGAYRAAGYPDREAFERDCRGSPSAYAACAQVDRYVDRAAIELSDDAVDRYALCADEGDRARVLGDAVEEAVKAASAGPIPFELAPEPEPAPSP